MGLELAGEEFHILIISLVIYAEVFYGYFGSGAGPLLLTSLECSGTEDSLYTCNNGSNPIYAPHSSDVGIVCEHLEAPVG